MTSVHPSADPQAPTTPTTDEAAEIQPPAVQFCDFDIDPRILSALTDLGYETPSAVQEQAIPPLLDGEDVMGLAQTGTGKT
ncbi:DEAD/DEAH box helicase, partial [Gordonia sp. UBA7860]